MSDTLGLVALVFSAAVLYSAVGHGGASGYLASMAIMGVAPAAMKPAALLLNVLVAGASSIRYVRQECFSWRVFWPFALTSIPFSFLGGATSPPEDLYRRALGGVLVVAAIGLLSSRKEERPAREVPVWLGCVCGAAIGLVSGLIGVGGGIFLSPLLILAGWATTRTTLGVSALFILVNSIAGLAGHWSSIRAVPQEIVFLVPVAFIGGLIGSGLGVKRLPPAWVRSLLSLVLLIAAGKLLLA